MTHSSSRSRQRLSGMIDRLQSRRWFCLQGNAVFLAVLPPRYWKQDLDLQEGSLLRVIGICSRQSDGTQLDARSGFPVATAFQILRQSPEDVIVLEAPSWWSAEHSMRVLAFALLLAVAALFGVLVLGHRVKRQTSTIRDSEKTVQAPRYP